MEQTDIYTEKAIVTCDGKVMWSLHRLLTMPCKVEIRTVKRVHCEPMFGPWVYTATDVDFQIERSDEIHVGYSTPGSKWRLEGQHG